MRTATDPKVFEVASFCAPSLLRSELRAGRLSGMFPQFFLFAMSQTQTRAFIILCGFHKLKQHQRSHCTVKEAGTKFWDNQFCQHCKGPKSKIQSNQETPDGHRIQAEQDPVKPCSVSVHNKAARMDTGPGQNKIQSSLVVCQSKQPAVQRSSCGSSGTTLMRVDSPSGAGWTWDPSETRSSQALQ